ncbi:TraR/DksA family transcriptional regulator [Pseudomonas luteola]
MSNQTEMNDALRAQFKERLKAEGIHNSNRIVELQDEMSLLQENQTDPLDQASVVEEGRKVMSEISRLQKCNKEIRYALDHFDDFGYCESCGVEIEVKRLNINPAITKCISCKTLEEVRQKQYAQ